MLNEKGFGKVAGFDDPVMFITQERITLSMDVIPLE